MFNLPVSTIVNRNIPKNLLENHAGAKQRKILTNTIAKIRWTHKLSAQTVNLVGTDISEIQVFEISLKQKDSVTGITTIMDRVIPYHLILLLQFEEEVMISASYKHIHPTNPDQAVIDWTFSSPWFSKNEFPYNLNLRQSLDYIYSDLCFQIAGNQITSDFDLKTLIAREQKIKQLNDQIQKLEAAIKSCKQFNKKVEMNLKLQEIKSELAFSLEPPNKIDRND